MSSKFERSHDLLIIHTPYFPLAFLDYNMFSLCLFFFSAINTKTAHIALGFFMNATANLSLAHIQAFIEMFASFACGLAGLGDSMFNC